MLIGPLFLVLPEQEPAVALSQLIGRSQDNHFAGHA
jgi:hypothetical protein